MTQLALKQKYPNTFHPATLNAIRRTSPTRSGQTLYPEYSRLREYQSKAGEKNLLQTISLLSHLRTWEDNWDGYGSKKPKLSLIKKATKVINDIYNFSRLNNDFFEIPNVSCSEVGEVTLEYWNKEKKISLYITSQGIECVKIQDDIFENIGHNLYKSFNYSDYQENFGWLNG